MKVESRLFEICTAFFLLAGIAYAILTKEAVGIACLFLTAGLSLIVGTYFRFVSRRIESRPEDNPDGEIADGAGEVGFFSPGSYWPVGLAACAALFAIGVAFFYVWLMVIAGVMLLFAVGGLVFEYHVRPADH